ncbi:hypothetical protein RIF29_12050 [Crotalaria pallida]|uniref:Uncharacterized protein n=1 Tax=Crotalaria pallida TaxID=3830 RepID=A0AAN9IMU3_CROPI
MMKEMMHWINSEVKTEGILEWIDFHSNPFLFYYICLMLSWHLCSVSFVSSLLKLVKLQNLTMCVIYSMYASYEVIEGAMVCKFCIVPCTESLMVCVIKK